MPQKSKSKRLFRSYTNFDNENFIKDLNELNLDFSNFSDVNLAYDNFNHQFTEVYDLVGQKYLFFGPPTHLSRK
jgi:hypothetical protein